MSKYVPVNPGSLAVLLVDMQERFVKNLRKKDRKLIVPKQVSVIRICAKRDIPLIVLEYKDQGQTIDELEKEIANVPRFSRIIKPCDNGFIDTELEDLLVWLGTTHLLVMGVNANGCVLGTAMGALDLDVCVVTAGDLIANETRTCFRKTGRDRSWYRKNGVFRSEVRAVRPLLGLSTPRKAHPC